MQWTDEGIVLAAAAHGEASAIVELFTAAGGRWRGLVRGGASRRMRPVVQAGNLVRASWSARLEEQLGSFRLEPLELRAGVWMEDGLALAGLGVLVADLRLLPEREAHPALYDGARLVLDHLEEPGVWPALLARFELRLLADLGFGLDLERCAASGSREELRWVSPRSGRVVSAAAASGLEERLLALPGFLRGGAGSGLPGAAEMAAALELTGFFLRRRVLEPRGLVQPLEREWIMQELARPAAAAGAAPALADERGEKEQEK